MQYRNETEKQLSQQPSPTNIQGRWKNIVATITKTPYKNLRLKQASDIVQATNYYQNYYQNFHQNTPKLLNFI